MKHLMRRLRGKRALQQDEERDEGTELQGDPRVGKRVLHLSMLPKNSIFGTIQSIVRYPNGMEYWKVLTDPGMMINGPFSSFTLYENAPELKAGDRVIEALDEGGTVQGTVIRAIWLGDELRFLIHYDDGDECAMPPTRFQKRE